MTEAIKHILVPEHVKLSDKEKKIILEKYHLTTRELPKIRKIDPAIGKLNAKSGDVIKITRKSQTAGKSIYYRVVIT
jgi:DNA-directed RNA polymerase subunit H